MAASGQPSRTAAECSVFTVASTQGEWLWIKSQHAYIKRSDIIAFDDAIPFYTQRLEVAQTSRNYRHRAEIWRLKGDLDSALSDMNAAINQSPNDFSLFVIRGILWHNKKEDDKAIADYSEAIRLNPQSVETRLQLCGLLEDDSPRDALGFAEQAVSLDPKSFKAHFVLGKLLFKTERLAESAKELETSRDLDPTSSAVRFALVRTYKSLGKEADAAREAAIFRRLRTAEDQFRTTGRVSPSYFEFDPAVEKPASKSPSESGPKGRKASAAQ